MENAYDILQKYLSGDCNNDEKAKVENWIAESTENQKLFDEIQHIWENSKNIADSLNFNHDNAWNRIKESTGIKDRRNVETKRLKIYPSLLKIAATLLFLIGIGTIIKLGFLSKPDFIIASTQNSAKQKICLSDGTIVFLNQNSQLKYPEKFTSATREVKLEGEAFFLVAKDKHHPFIVHAKGTNTRVLGTSFNINTKNPAQVSIAVFSGKVAFRTEKSNNQEVKLTKGESGIYNISNVSIIKQVGANDNAIAWQTGILRFNKTPLIEATNTLSEYYSRKIEVAPQLQNRLISVTFDNQPLSKALEIMELTLDIKVDTTSGKIMLTPLDI